MKGVSATWNYPSGKKLTGEVNRVEINLGKDAVDLDHLISPEKRLLGDL
jgi:hypothetical protein